MKKRLISILIVVFLTLTIGQPQFVFAEDLPPIFQSFISDSRWCDGASWSGSKTPEISSFKCWGCCAYCADFTKYCFGIDNPRGGEVFYDTNEIRAGDVLTVGNQSDGSGHWFVCLMTSGNSLYVAEGNISGRVRIGWNYSISSNKRFSGSSLSFTAGYHFMDDRPIDTVDVLSGVYVIHSAADYNMCLDIVGNSTENNAYIQMYHREADLDVQKFRVIKWGDGYYHISSIHNGRLLDVETPIEDRARVKLYYESGKDFEEDFWYFEGSITFSVGCR